MRSGSTDTVTENIVLGLNSPNFRATAYMEVETTIENGNSVYTYLEDLDAKKGIDWSESGKNEKYANFILTPLAGTIKFNVNNINGRYSPGSGTSFDGIFKTNTKVRLNSGYFLETPKAEVNNTVDLNDISGNNVLSYYYNMSYSGGVVVVDGSGSSIVHFKDYFIPLYDSVLYDSTNYSPSACTIHTYDALKPGYEEITNIAVTANNTSGKIYYRSFNDVSSLTYSTVSNWTYLGDTVNGEASFPLSGINKRRFYQVGIVFDSLGGWTGGENISDIVVTTKSYIDIIYQNVYYLDTPSFDDPAAPKIPKIFIKGRDAFKRAINKSINMEDFSGSPLNPDEVIKKICDKIEIKYTSDSIDPISETETINWDAGFADVIKGDLALNYVMEKISQTGYQMWLQYDSTEDDNIIYVKKKPTTFESVGAFSYKNYVSISDSRRNADKALQRFTAITNQQVVTAEEQLDQQTVSSTGVTSFTWSGNAVYKRISVDLPNNITATADVSPTSIDLNVTAITGSVVITIYGNKWLVTDPVYEGEAINFYNQTQGIGTTTRTINPFIQFDSECKLVSESFVNNFADPVQETQGLLYPYLNLLPEINDSYLMWRRFFYDTNIYFITGISHHYDESESPKQTTSFNLDDSGLNFDNISNYEYDEGNPAIVYNTGLLYDMGISTPQSTDAEIDAATTLVYNTGEA